MSHYYNDTPSLTRRDTSSIDNRVKGIGWSKVAVVTSFLLLYVINCSYGCPSRESYNSILERKKAAVNYTLKD